MKARKKRMRGMGRLLEPGELAGLGGQFETVSLDEAAEHERRLHEEDAGEGGWLDVVERERVEHEG